MVIGCKDIRKLYGIDVILDKVTFNLEEKQKAAVVGVNGAGKTTLFKILSGEESSDGGELFFKKDITIGYLEQNAQLESEDTIYNSMLEVFGDVIELENSMAAFEKLMPGLEGQELEKCMQKYADARHSFEQKEGYSYKSRIKGVLKGLGFFDEQFDMPVKNLSGGQKTRLYLGRLLLARHDVLLLDEPTNHLDIESIEWLEDFIKGYNGAVLLISHDRYFMDKTVSKIIEIENKKSTVYDCSYSKYSKEKEIRRNILVKQYNDQQKEIKRQEDIIKTLKAFNREKSVKRAESREKNLEKMERIEAPESLPDKMRIRLVPKIQSGGDVLYAENISKSFDENVLFSNVSLDIKRGDKVAIIGPNGVGKTTLFKILLGKISCDDGKIVHGANVHIGYYDQEQESLSQNKTIFDEISDTYPNMTNGDIRDTLAAFVFMGDDVFKTISSLSGGEKGRVSLAKIMLSKSNLLMLDEPTNHLDMFSKEILEDAINSYEGTVIYISHDRYFINRTAQKILELTPSGIIQYIGDYDYYLEKRAPQYSSSNRAVSQESKVQSKQDWISKKEEQAKARKLAGQIEKLEKDIENAENEIKNIDDMLFSDEVSSDSQKANELFIKKNELEQLVLELYEQWDELQQS